ncbi:MAG: hypothetical protein GXO74_04675 [Calditrichaeota bacterium]|nr:hypothetical protein [Calditrichota bacterium]
MKKIFTEDAIGKIADLLNCNWKFQFNNYRLTLADDEGTRQLSLEIYPDIKIGEKRGSVISVLTENSHLQLQFCSGFVLSEMNQEVTFYSETGGKVCGLIVERGAGCSLYANVDKEALSGDWTNMGPEVMLSGIALSLTESFIDQ